MTAQRKGVVAVGDGPQQVQDACETALAVLVGSLPSSAVAGSRAQWAAAVGAVQQVVNVAVAVQDAAIARLAAIEPEWLEDGTEVETHRGLGHAALDAPAIVSGVLAVSSVHAERRTRVAVRLAGDGPEGSVSATGLGGLHEAMSIGVLDAYRAGVVAQELELAPPQVAAAVVAALQPRFGVDDAPALRRRCRQVISRVSPDLLVQRAKKARSQCGLRRWAEEPGVDRWEGTFPSEDAATAWAAIDTLAHQYLNNAVCSTIEQARGKALTDLVTSNATIEAVITLTVPATIPTRPIDDQGAVATQAAAELPDSTEPVDAPAETSSRGLAERAQPAPSAAGAPTRGLAASGGAEPAASAVAELPASRALDPVTTGETGPAASGETRPAESSGSDPTASDLTGPATREPVAPVEVAREGDLVEVTGLVGNQPVLVPRSWVNTTLEDQRRADPRKVTTAQCHPETGALLGTDPHVGQGTYPRAGELLDGRGSGMPVDADVAAASAAAAQFGAGSYRPSARLARRIRARDRRCRFPGCHVAAVFCDLDHVRPWPTGPTTDTNLICLCRRHHRIKQRPGWYVTLTTDGTLTWTDPTGAKRTTLPVDALHPLVLPDPTAAGDTTAATDTTTGGGSNDTGPSSQARTLLPDGPHSDLEFTHEHLTAGLPWTPTWRDHHGRRHRVELTPPPWPLDPETDQDQPARTHPRSVRHTPGYPLHPKPPRTVDQLGHTTRRRWADHPHRPRPWNPSNDTSARAHTDDPPPF